MNTHIVTISFLPRGTTGLALTAVVAGIGVTAKQVARVWAHENALDVETWSILESIQVPQDGTVVDVT